MIGGRWRVAAGLALAAVFIAVPSTAIAAPAVSPAGAASLAGLSTAAATDLRSRMLNVPGSVISGAAPTAFASEQMAAGAMRNTFYDLIDREFADSPLDRAYARGQLAQDGYFTSRNGTRTGNGVTFRPPAVRPTPLAAPAPAAGGVARFVGPVAAGLLGWQIGTAGGRMVSEAMGLNVEGGLCKQDFNDYGFVAFVTGQECPDLLAQTQAWRAHVATLTGMSGASTCTSTGSCIQLLTSAPYTYQGVTRTALCFRTTGTSSTGYIAARAVPGAAVWSKAPGWDRLNMNTLGASSGAPSNARMACGLLYPDQISSGSGYWAAEGSVTAYGYVHAATATLSNQTAVQTQGADSLQTIQCTITDQNGGQHRLSSEPYPAGGGSLSTPKCPELAGGLTPSRIELAEVGPNGTTQLADQQTTPAFRDWMQTYPQCADGSCALDLVKLVNGTQVSCFQNDTACVDWFNDPQKGSVYQCTYGGATLALSECNAYQGIFDPARLAVGAPYSDPATGTWTGGQTAPSSGTQGAQAMATAIQNPEAQRNCMPSGWGILNPVEWVTKPVQCALEWAFVPRPTMVQYQMTTAQLALEGTPPAQVIAAVNAFDPELAASGCSRQATMFGVTFDVWNVCPGTPMAPIAAISRLAINVSFMVLAFVLVRRQIAGTVDYQVAS